MEGALTKSTPVAWVVSAMDKAKCDETFQSLDTDLDGFINGGDAEVKRVFLLTGLPQAALAHIWGLCDVKQNGKLNSEQFALAMYLVNQTKQGFELPSTLLPEMVPPTLRPKPTGTVGVDSLLNSPQSQSNGIPKSLGSISGTGNKELDLLTEELRELQNEKNKLEEEANQQEAVMKLKQSDIKNLRNEAETLQQMIKQLENQKVEARKRLDEMAVQVDNLRKQVDEQKEKVEAQEIDLSTKQKELDGLRSEESKLQQKLDDLKKELSNTSGSLADTQIRISQYKTKLMSYEEYEKQLNNGISDLDSALANNDYQRLHTLLIRSITPPLSDLINDSKNGFESDPFKDKDVPFPSLSHEFSADPFAGEDPFDGEDMFRQNDVKSGEMFASDPFGASPFATQNNGRFSGTDPFGSSSKTEPAGDFFADAFSGGRPESPTPELPPKRSKAPPPRPVPPKSGNKPPPRPAPPPASGDPFKAADPWGSTATTNAPGNDPFAPSAAATNQGSTDPFGSNFADFSNFDKFDIMPAADPYASLRSVAKRNVSEKESHTGSSSFNASPVSWLSNSSEEKERKRRQEQEDYELALSLSKTGFADWK